MKQTSRLAAETNGPDCNIGDEGRLSGDERLPPGESDTQKPIYGKRSACAGDVKSPRRGSIIIAGGAMQSDGNHHRSELGG